jgi:hypothetical protein
VTGTNNSPASVGNQGSLICSKCGGPRETKHTHCRACKAAFMRANRPKHSQLTPEQKRKANARARARVALSRGQLTRQRCQGCGGPHAQMHHEDYSKPLEVVWLCQRCHSNEHNRHHRNWGKRRD